MNLDIGVEGSVCKVKEIVSRSSQTAVPLVRTEQESTVDPPSLDKPHSPSSGSGHVGDRTSFVQFVPDAANDG